jgi:hypothetical protein
MARRAEREGVAAGLTVAVGTNQSLGMHKLESGRYTPPSVGVPSGDDRGSQGKLAAMTFNTETSAPNDKPRRNVFGSKGKNPRYSRI